MSSYVFLCTTWFLGAFIIASLIGATLVNTFIPAQQRIAHRMITQPVLTVVGMMFSVLLGFFIAQSMRNYGEMGAHITQEANALGNLFRFASGLDDYDRRKIRMLCREYADVVCHEEWKLMAECKSSDKAWDVYQHIWEAVLTAKPHTPQAELALSRAMVTIESLGEDRRWRIAMCSYGLAPHFWIIIALGAASIITLTFLFAPESKKFHTGVITCIIVPLTLNAYLLTEYSYPFSGMIAIEPTTFKLLQRQLFLQPDTPLGQAVPVVPTN